MVDSPSTKNGTKLSSDTVGVKYGDQSTYILFRDTNYPNQVASPSIMKESQPKTTNTSKKIVILNIHKIKETRNQQMNSRHTERKTSQKLLT
jgi:hypothetical protein